MSVAFYMDVHVPRAVVAELRKRGIDVLTAQEDGTARLSDEALLSRAASLQRVMVSQDVDLIEIAQRFLRAEIPFTGLIFARQRMVAIGAFVCDLELIGTTVDSDEMLNTILYLPL